MTGRGVLATHLFGVWIDVFANERECGSHSRQQPAEQTFHFSFLGTTSLYLAFPAADQWWWLWRGRKGEQCTVSQGPVKKSGTIGSFFRYSFIHSLGHGLWWLNLPVNATRSQGAQMFGLTFWAFLQRGFWMRVMFTSVGFGTQWPSLRWMGPNQSVEGLNKSNRLTLPEWEDYSCLWTWTETWVLPGAWDLLSFKLEWHHQLSRVSSLPTCPADLGTWQPP